jgi:hypothetical protein
MQYLYLIKCQQFYKIGVANDVESRLAQLSTGNPFELKVLAVYGFDNAEPIERALHQKFSSKRERGEWFFFGSSETKSLEDFHTACRILGGIANTADELPIVEDREIAEAEQEQELLSSIGWRLEVRNDRTPPGFAIFRRGGEKKYLGYIGKAHLKNPEHPTIEEVEAVISTNGHSDCLVTPEQE